jgi:hypothetical protein
MIVKRNGGKVILKGGKVSCSCCAVEPDCCLYPADKLGDTYEVEDLPDAVTINGVSSDKYPTGGIPDLGDGGTPGYWKGGTPQTGDYCISEFGSGVWRLFIYDEDEWDSVDGFPCLIAGDGNLTPGDDTVEDQFADCYEISWENDPDDGGPSSVQVTRTGLCSWQGGGNKLIYQQENDEDKWFVGIFFPPGLYEGYQRDDVPSSSPNGSYQVDFFEVVSVSECLHED